jgi:hypothetical protein
MVMTVGSLVNEIHELIEKKAPQGTSPLAILERAIDSFTPSKKAKIDAQKAKAILLARGAIARKKLEEAEGGAMSTEEVAELLGLSRQGVDYLRKTKAILAWRNTNGKWNYPVWQFDSGRIRPGIRECLKALTTDDPWGRMIFFLSPRDSLNGDRPLDLIVKREIDAAIAVARRHQQHGAY